jgi:hypothetical protein
MNKILGITLAMCVVATGCGKKSVAIPKTERREAAILKCVDEFKTGLIRLSKEHSELAGVEQFDATRLGFTFVNNQIRPRVHISLAVEDGPLSEMHSVPVKYEELPDIPAVIGFELECEGNAELKASIKVLYDDFKAALRKELGAMTGPAR